MQLKLIMALVNDEKTEAVCQAARDAGATGLTIIASARGEGLKPEKSFLGLDLSGLRDVILVLVAEPKSRAILEAISIGGRFDEEPGTGIAVQMDIEDAVGMGTQMATIQHEIEEEL